MRQWVAVTAVLWLLAASPAHAQMKPVKGFSVVPNIADVAKNRRLDLRVSQQFGNEGHVPLVPSMMIRQDLTPSASVGLGLANMYAKRRSGDFSSGDRPVRSRKPAVTFLLRF